MIVAMSSFSRHWSTSSTKSKPLHIMTIEDPIEFLHTQQPVQLSTSARSVPNQVVSLRRSGHVLAKTRT